MKLVTILQKQHSNFKLCHSSVKKYIKQAQSQKVKLKSAWVKRKMGDNSPHLTFLH